MSWEEQLRKSDRPILVIGLGRSGIAAARYLSSLGLLVVALDSSERENLHYLTSGELSALQAKDVQVLTGPEAIETAGRRAPFSLVVPSPAVHLDHPLLTVAKDAGTPVRGEFELGLLLQNCPTIAVTGSNGKSTVVSLVHDMLLRAGFKSKLCGNIGVPVMADLGSGASPDHDWLVVEASSYQLESLAEFRPRIGVVLNLSENHLERHGTMSAYLEAKAKVFAFQTKNDFAVLNADDALVAGLAPGLTAATYFFGEENKESLSSVIQRDSAGRSAAIRLSLDGQTESYSLENTRLIGGHNAANIAAAALVARFAEAAPEAIQESIDAFVPLEHRLEVLEQQNGSPIVNDAKSTTVASTIAAWKATRESYPEQPTILLIGGKAKKGSWDSLFAALRDSHEGLKALICYGEDGGYLYEQALCFDLPTQKASSLAEAVSLARGEMERSPATLLLSPGCASFDEFLNFEERGRAFKNLVLQSSLVRTSG